MITLHLLGVSPMDPRGPVLMRRALATLRPDRITLPANEALLAHLRGEFVERNLAAVQRCVDNGLSEERATYLGNHIRTVFNYQHFVPMAYAQETETPLHMVGDNREVERSKRFIQRMSLDARAAEHHDFNHFRRISDESYESHRKYLNHSMHLGDLVSPQEKDVIATQAVKIMDVAQTHGGKIVHVTGLRNCLDTYVDSSQTLRSSLKALNPTVSFLCGYGNGG